MKHVDRIHTYKNVGQNTHTHTQVCTRTHNKIEKNGRNKKRLNTEKIQ